MDFLDAIPKVTSLFTLIAFAIAVTGALVSAYLSREARLISKVPPDQRAKLIARFLDRHGLASGHLTREQQYSLLRDTIRQRKYPWLMLSLAALLLTLILLSLIVSQAVRGDHTSLLEAPHIKPAAEGETLILVADFDGPEIERYRVKDVIASNLKASLPTIRVEPLLGPISLRNGGSSRARTEGEKYGATFVIWGWYSLTSAAVSISVNFELIKLPYTLIQLCPSANGDVRTATAEDLQTFKLQLTLARELTDLTLIVSGIATYLTGDCPSAVSFLSQFLSRSYEPNREITSAAFFMRGDCYLAENKPALAIRDLSQSINNAPSIYAYSRLGDAHSALGNNKESLNCFSTAVQLAPRRAEMLVKLGIAHERLGTMTSALPAYQQAIGINDNLVFGEGVSNYLHYISGGEVADIEDPKASTNALIVALSNRLAASPKHPLARFARARLINDLSLAITDFKRLVNQFPAAASLHYEIANALLRAHNPRGAIQEYNHALAIAPSHACSYAKRGGAYYVLGNNQLALQSYNKALDIDATSENALFGRAGIYFSEGKEQEAIADLSKVIESGGYLTRSGDALTIRGALYLRRMRLLAAYNDLDRALHLEPTHKVAAHYMDILLGIVLFCVVALLLVSTGITYYMALRGRREKRRKGAPIS